VQTDISAAYAQLVGKHMEAILQQYSSRFRDYGRVTARFNVIVYNHEADYLRAVPPQVRGSTGVFMAGRQLLAAHADKRTTEEVLRTLYHEGFHQFMYEVVSPSVPVWLNEGLAEYFSDATWNGQTFTLGQVSSVRLYVVQQAVLAGNYIPFRRFFRMTSENWLQDISVDRRRASIQYAQAWSIVHFLIHADGGRYAPMLNTLLRSIREGRLPERVMEDIFGDDYGQFERAWARYVMALQASPKYICRDNMESLLLLAKFIYPDPRSLKSVEQLRHDVLYRTRARWQITHPTGKLISSDQADQVLALFRCPLDRSDAETSYQVIRNVRTGLPVLVCRHHPGVVTLAYYEPEPNGELSIRVEEQVWETLTPDLRQAILAATP